MSSTVPDKDSDGNIVNRQALFKAKDAHSFKGKGIKGLVSANSTATISYTCSSGMKFDFSGIEILNADLGDEFQLSIIDLDGKYGVGVGMELDNFGENWNARPNFIKEMPYASRLMEDMRVDVIFTNNTASDKTIYVNLDLYKVTMP